MTAPNPAVQIKLKIAPIGVELWQIDKILPYGKNAKLHNSKQVALLAKNIQEFGWDVPIVVDKEGVIIKGHGRRLAALKLGMTEVPVIVRDDLSPAQIRAARLADNKVAEGAHDDDILRQELQELLNDDLDLGILGFDDRELKDLMPKVALQDVTITDGEGAVIRLDAPQVVKQQEYKPTHQIVVEVSDEQEQEQIYNRLVGEGLKCRLLSL